MAIPPEVRDDAVKTKGYFIYPSQLFVNVAANANTNESLNTDLASIFVAIEASANGYPSKRDIKGLFADFNTNSIWAMLDGQAAHAPCRSCPLQAPKPSKNPATCPASVAHEVTSRTTECCGSAAGPQT